VSLRFVKNILDQAKSDFGNSLQIFAPVPAVFLAGLLTILPKELMNYLRISHLHTLQGFLKPVLAIFFK